jgi:hypothetical protein
MITGSSSGIRGVYAEQFDTPLGMNLCSAGSRLIVTEHARGNRDTRPGYPSQQEEGYEHDENIQWRRCDGVVDRRGLLG